MLTLSAIPNENEKSPIKCRTLGIISYLSCPLTSWKTSARMRDSSRLKYIFSSRAIVLYPYICTPPYCNFRFYCSHSIFSVSAQIGWKLICTKINSNKACIYHILFQEAKQVWAQALLSLPAHTIRVMRTVNRREQAPRINQRERAPRIKTSKQQQQQPKTPPQRQQQQHRKKRPRKHPQKN